MPRIELKHVVSFTSEDPKNPADNLLKPEDYYKWKCASPGESKCAVVLQFEKATQIRSVDIGNNGSAFVEVLVGRSSWDPGEEEKVLLVASSFMSPSESKSLTNSFRVRLFGPEKLNKTIAAEKWDRVKIVCTQPYNNAECYGLSFVTFHSPPEQVKEVNEEETASKTLNFKKKIGKFTLKDDSDVDEIKVGSYFAKKLQHGTSAASLSTAASARDASSSIRLSAMTSSPSESVAPSLRKADRATTLKPKDERSTAVKREPKNTETSSVKRREDPQASLNSSKQSNKSEATMRNEEGTSKRDLTQEKREKITPPSKKVKRMKKDRMLPFHRLMRNVVFVLSGYKNPERSDLRDQAISMGAQYRPDWVSGCTHLICAFKNTPKYIQVLGKGKIVSHKWIKDCAKKRERIPTKNYRVDDGGASSSDPDSDYDDNGSAPVNPKSSPSRNAPTSEGVVHGTKEKDTSLLNIDEPMPGPSRTPEYPDSEDCDTEDELRKARESLNPASKNNDASDDDDDDYGGSTEDESDTCEIGERIPTRPLPEPVSVLNRRSDLPPLPNFFNQDRFLIYGDFKHAERRLLVRYITAYNGIVCDYMNDGIKYVITDKDWDKTFDEAVATNPALEFIRSSWIMKCHESSQRVSLMDHQINRTK